jgi:hypothetical protein
MKATFLMTAIVAVTENIQGWCGEYKTRHQQTIPYKPG